MTLPLDLKVAVVAIVVVAIVFAVRMFAGRGAPAPTVPVPRGPAVPRLPAGDDVAKPPPSVTLHEPLPDETGDPDGVPQAIEPPAPLTWPRLITGDSGELDEPARIRLLADLGIVRATWCVPVLLRACEEETNPAVRRAALAALGGFRASPDARVALEHAVAANDADERAIASAALRTFA